MGLQHDLCLLQPFFIFGFHTLCECKQEQDIRKTRSPHHHSRLNLAEYACHKKTLLDGSHSFFKGKVSSYTKTAVAGKKYTLTEIVRNREAGMLYSPRGEHYVISHSPPPMHSGLHGRESRHRLQGSTGSANARHSINALTGNAVVHYKRFKFTKCLIGMTAMCMELSFLKRS